MAGSKYLDTEIENAINGVKQMKSLMDKTSKDHQAILDTLEETKQQKEVGEAGSWDITFPFTLRLCGVPRFGLWDAGHPAPGGKMSAGFS